MSDERKVFETHGIPTVYCNQANVSMSYNDIRVYIGEVSPKELAINPVNKEDYIQKEPLFDPKYCLVISPEFSRSLAKAIMLASEKYESIFGPLRPEPTPQSVATALEKK